MFLANQAAKTAAAKEESERVRMETEVGKLKIACKITHVLRFCFLQFYLGQFQLDPCSLQFLRMADANAFHLYATRRTELMQRQWLMTAKWRAFVNRV